ncbi:MAG: hypothetical protein V5A40_19830, partial [Haloarculaceae archaeon]
DRDGWERVEEYQRVLEWRGKYPNKGSSAAASALDLPRSRIRPWFEGSKPDPVHAVDTAEQHGWLDARPGDRILEALSVLHAWVYAGGSIEQRHYVPTFAVGSDDPRDLAIEALRAVGLDATVARADEPGRATEVRPAGDGGSHLGRFLHGVLGAPVGPKNERSDIEIPAWLTAVGASTRLRWARVYVVLRSTRIDDTRHGYSRLIKEERSRSFRRAFGELLSGLAPRDSVTVGKRGVLLRPDASREFDVVPSLPE